MPQVLLGQLHQRHWADIFLLPFQGLEPPLLPLIHEHLRFGGFGGTQRFMAPAAVAFLEARIIAPVLTLYEVRQLIRHYPPSISLLNRSRTAASCQGERTGSAA